MKSRTPRTSRVSSRSRGFYEQSTIDYSSGLSARSSKNLRYNDNQSPFHADFVKLLPITFGQNERDDRLGSDILGSLNFSLSQEVQNIRKKNRLQNQKIIDQLRSQPPETLLAHQYLKPFIHKKERVGRQLSILTTRPQLAKPRSLSKGTFSMLTTYDTKLPALNSTPKGDFIFPDKVDNSSKRNMEALRNTLLNWLIDTKKEIVDKINGNHELIYSWMAYLHSIGKNEFDELLKTIGIKYNPHLYERLFWLFDMDGDGTIHSKELLMGLDWLKEHNPEDFFDMFFSLVDEDGNGYVSEDRLVEFLKKQLQSEEDRRRVQPAVRHLIQKELYGVSKDTITRGDLAKAYEKIDAFRTVVEKIVRHGKRKDQTKARRAALDNLATKVEVKQEGFSRPYMERLVNAMEEKHNIARQWRPVKHKYTKTFNFQSIQTDTKID